MELCSGPCNSACQAIEFLIQKGVPEAHIIFLNLISVEQLVAENTTLFEKLNATAQQLREATTTICVLKSDVQALRAKLNLSSVWRQSRKMLLCFRLPGHRYI
ncbi:hypothetical protein SOVF_063660 isoform B [Spinacia oleracea]|nr:hypothetical protein SOVF_063660 isoform B [Spinacia oleracea]